MHEIGVKSNEDLAFERFFTINLDLLCIATIEGTFVKLNKSWETVLGYTTEELEGKRFLDFIHPDDLEATLNTMAVLSEDIPVLNFTNRYKCKDDSYKYIEWRSKPYGNLIYAAARDITDKIEKQKTIEEKEENFRTFFETMDDLIFVATVQGLILHTNKAVIEKLGYSKEQLSIMHVLDVHPEIYRTEAEEIFSDMFKGMRDYCPLPLKKKDGSFLPVETRVWLGKWNGSDCIYGISKDLSKQQAALEKFQKLFDNNPALMAVSSMATNIFEDVNVAFLKKLGYSKEEILGKTSSELAMFVDDKRQKEIGLELLKNGRIQDVELKVRKKDGSTLDGLFSGEIIDNQGQKSFLTIMIDITQQRKKERELNEAKTSIEKQKNFLKQMLNAIPDMIFYKDTLSAYLGCNSACAENFIGQKEEEIIGKTDLELLKDKELAKFFRQKDMEILEARETIKTEETLKMVNNTMIDVETLKTLFYDENGDVAGIIGISRDISFRKSMEEKLVKAKEQAESANVMKSQFLTNMSHEIRTPMNGILGFLDLIQRTSLSSEQKDYIKEAKTASEILLYLINDILDFSKIEAGKITIENESFRIRTAVEDAVSTLMPKVSEKGLQLYTIIKENVPEEVIGDSARLRQILNNLISNAVKFTQKGEIIVSVACEEEIEGKAVLHFEIKDTGIGISEQNINKLFAPFIQADASTTRKFGGTGLGLAISKELVKLMDGDISVESEIGKGSTFKFSVLLKISKKSKERNAIKRVDGMKVLELKQKNDKEIQMMDSNFSSQGKEGLLPKILLVEDNEMNRKIVVAMLKQQNIDCDIAVNGAEAVEAISEKEYDIIFMDCQMPVMDGYESTAKIRELEAGIKHTTIIAMTANAMEGDRERCIKAGMDDYISKPIKFDNMFKMIKDNTKSKEKNLGCYNIKNAYMDEFIKETGLEEKDALEIFEDFAKYLPEILKEIQKSLDSKDYVKLRVLAHQLKGTSGNLRVKTIYELTINLENAALKEEKEKCESFLIKIKECI